ncbi:hypothetical protein SO802_027439 [Lithocarpus litseifolius]|uniref:Uncharacterized protein n=1 Tax=Lithocarpus litseifolius TaxID=425828 RepID=A0AAW2C2M4_9ROSI
MAACCDQRMSSFKVLKLQCIDVTDEALESIGTCCLSLELLVLYNLQRFTDRSVTLHLVGIFYQFYLLISTSVVSFCHEHESFLRFINYFFTSSIFHSYKYFISL